MGKRKASTLEEKKAEQDRKELIARQETAFQCMQNDAILCDTLLQAMHTGDYTACALPIWQKYGEDLFAGKHAHDIINGLLSWAGRKEIRPTLAPNLEEVLRTRDSQRSTYNVAKRRLLKSARLNPGTFDKDVFYASIPVRSCKRLSQPFPPPNLYVSEDKTIYKRNMKFVLERDLPDSRKWRKLIYELNDKSLLTHDLGPTENAVFFDKDELVAVVLRKACKHEGVVQYIDKTVKKVVDSRNNIRKEDRGHLSQMGLSAGSLSHSSLGWVRNIAREKTNYAKNELINYEASSSFAVLWALVRTLLPDEIIADFDLFLDTIGPELRMDGNQTMGMDANGRGTYKIVIDSGKREFEFHHAQLAPPAGVMAENYCRFVHYEHQPHKWAVSLTTSRKFNSTTSPAKAGGHFYIASYGIRVQAAPNTLIAWRPSDWHGTSLFRIDPEGFHQRGLCFVTGNRLLGEIKKWRGLDGIDISHAEAETEEENQLNNLVTELRRSPRLALKKDQFEQLLANYRAWEKGKN